MYIEVKPDKYDSEENHVSSIKKEKEKEMVLM